MAGIFVVFLLPAIISIFFGAVVLAEVLKDPDRELNMWQFGTGGVVIQSDVLKITGLKKQYSVSESVTIEVSMKDPFFDCGDLYITIYDLSKTPQEVITQSGFFDQCFVRNNSFMPMDDEFSEQIDAPGEYELLVHMNDKHYKKTVRLSEKFLVK